jgi:molybdopterin biosynthesis enzyme
VIKEYEYDLKLRVKINLSDNDDVASAKAELVEITDGKVSDSSSVFLSHALREMTCRRAILEEIKDWYKDERV